MTVPFYLTSCPILPEYVISEVGILNVFEHLKFLNLLDNILSLQKYSRDPQQVLKVTLKVVFRDLGSFLGNQIIQLHPLSKEHQHAVITTMKYFKEHKERCFLSIKKEANKLAWTASGFYSIIYLYLTHTYTYYTSALTHTRQGITVTSKAHN